MVDVRAYAWLTNTRPPVHTAERIGLLAGMAGFLVVERHSALLIVAVGESVAAVGIGAAGPAGRPGGASWTLLAIALLGLVVAAAVVDRLWLRRRRTG